MGFQPFGDRDVIESAIEMPGAGGGFHRWRQGRSVGRTIYRDDDLVGTMDTPELAVLLVVALNGLTDPAEVTGAEPEFYQVDQSSVADGGGRVIVNDDGIIVGMLDSEDLARQAVEAMNVFLCAHPEALGDDDGLL